MSILPMIRPATVAGSFYPSDSTELRQIVQNYLSKVPESDIHNPISGIVAPHAGFVFSGQTAAYAYKQLIGQVYDLAIVLSPSHTKYFQGSSIFPGDSYSTPLGYVQVDKEFAEAMIDSNRVYYSLNGHEWERVRQAEHALEVQLPFLQVVQPNLKIVPIVIGSQDQTSLNALVQSIRHACEVTGKKILIIASSDLSHFHPLQEANRIDSRLIQSFSQSDYFKLELNCMSNNFEACGYGPIVVAMQLGENFKANTCKALHYATSADSEFSKDSNSVVGYFSGTIYQDPANPESGFPEFSENDRKYLLELAKSAIEAKILKQKLDFKLDTSEKYGLCFPAFVTINKNHQLRGCMGHIIGIQDINSEIISVAGMAATEDYRFGPILPNELNDLTYDVTLLSTMKRLFDLNEIEIGKHGLYIRNGRNSGLLLPQVATENNWSRDEFLQNVCRKAGLTVNAFLDKDTQLYKFEAVIIED